jgi:hypothetical protein
MRRLTHLIVLTAFILSCGGNWYVLQGIAWVKMIQEYSETQPLAKAIAMTLSGEYPCEMCKAIAEKKKADTDQLCALDKLEKKFFPPVSAAPATPRVTQIQYAGQNVSFQPRAEAPPTPPPRALLA